MYVCMYIILVAFRQKNGGNYANTLIQEEIVIIQSLS